MREREGSLRRSRRRLAVSPVGTPTSTSRQNGAAGFRAHGRIRGSNATLVLGALAPYAYATSLTCDGRAVADRTGALSGRGAQHRDAETCAGVELAPTRRVADPPADPRAAAEWSDYAERSATHGASQAQRGPGELLYTTPLGMASRKGLSGHGWGAPTKAFWCCYGTGAEALAKLPDGTFFRARGGAPEPGLDAGDGANARRSHVVVHERDTVYVARATVSAAAAWREAGAEVAVVADAFVLADAELGGGGDDVREGEEERGEGEASAKIHRGAPCEGCWARGGFATVTRVRVRRFEPGAGGSGGGEEDDAEEAARDASSAARDASSRDPLAVRLLVPGWSRGAASGLAPSILLGGRPLRAAGCRPGDRPPTWCEVSREWAEFPADSEELVAAFPMVLRAEPLLGSDDENAFERFERGDPFAEGSRSTNTGPVSSSLRHAIVAGPAVLAALGPGAWIGDLRVPRRTAADGEGVRERRRGIPRRRRRTRARRHLAARRERRARARRPEGPRGGRNGPRPGSSPRRVRLR